MATKSGKGRASASAKRGKMAPKRAGKAVPKKHAAPKSSDRKAPAAAPRAAKPGSPKPVPAKAAPGKAATTKAAPAKGVPGKAGATRPTVSKKTAPGKGKKAGRQREFDDLRRALAERQRELVRAYAMSKGDTRTHLDSGTEDYIDYAVSSYTKEFVLSLTEMDRKQLVMVEEALARLARGEYGLCQQCAEEIPRKRLEVAPWVRYCVRCQGLEEQGLLPQYPSRLDADEGGEDEEAAPAEYEGEHVVEDEEEAEEEPLVVDDEGVEEIEED